MSTQEGEAMKRSCLNWIFTTLTLITIAIPQSADAAVRVSSMFANGMVLQRNATVPIWGWGNVGEEVVVTFRDQTEVTHVDAEGKWKVTLSPLTVGEAASLTVKGSENVVTFNDVLVGEVWICSGQSNMQWSVNVSLNPDLVRAGANRPQIRLFQIPLLTADTPQEDVLGTWRPCTPETVGDFSSIGYHFACQLNDVLQVPVGIIQSAWGGTYVEPWTSPTTIANHEAYKPINDTWAARLQEADSIEATKAYEPLWTKWQEDWKAARLAGQPTPARPQHPEKSRWSREYPGAIYNCMIAPVAPYAIRGVIWYQGENNVARAYQYRQLMPAMVQSWRDAWGQGDFPFYQVQLANFLQTNPQPGESAWAELREAQVVATKALPNFDVACIIEKGAALDIHPKDKATVADRLARLAFVDIYGVPGVIAKGPMYESVTFDGNKAVVKFNNFGSPLSAYYGEEIKGFELQGEDGNRAWAAAKILGPDTVELVAEGIEKPVAVRYGWGDNPVCTLYNQVLLPAYPFRSDDNPGLTINNVNP